MNINKTGGIGDLIRADQRVINFVDQAVKDYKEVEGLSGKESYLANKEAEKEEARKAFLLQRDTEEINEDNRRLDHNDY